MYSGKPLTAFLGYEHSPKWFNNDIILINNLEAVLFWLFKKNLPNLSNLSCHSCYRTLIISGKINN